MHLYYVRMCHVLAMLRTIHPKEFDKEEASDLCIEGCGLHSPLDTIGGEEGTSIRNGAFVYTDGEAVSGICCLLM